MDRQLKGEDYKHLLLREPAMSHQHRLNYERLNAVIEKHKNGGSTMMRRRSDNDKDSVKTFVEQQLSIVKYEAPVLKTNRCAKPQQFKEEERRNPDLGFPILPKLPGLHHPRLLTRDSMLSEEPFGRCLRAMYNNKEYEENGRVFEQTISTKQARRDELCNLQRILTLKEHKLGVHNNSHSKMKVCLSLRSFDELIRQETLCCIERGVIMKEMCEFFELCFKIYQAMEERSQDSFREISSVLDNDQKLKSLQEEHLELISEVHDLNVTLESKEAALDEMQEDYRRNFQVLDRTRLTEVFQLRKCNLAIMQMLEAVNPSCTALETVRKILDQEGMAMV